MRQQIVLFGDSITEQSFRSGGWGAALADNFSRKADILNRGYGGYNTRWALFMLNHIFPLLNSFNGSSQVLLQSYYRSNICSSISIPSSPCHVDLGCLTSDTLAKIQGSAKPPVVTTVFFGANDAAVPGRTSERQHVPVDEYKENLRRIVEHLKECSPTMSIVLITPPPVDEEGRFEFARLLHGDKSMTLSERTNEMAGIYADKCVELAKELNLPSINLWSKMQKTEGWQKKYLSDGLHLTEEGNAVVYKEVSRVLSEVWHTASELPYDFPHHSVIDSEHPEKAFQKHLVGMCDI